MASSPAVASSPTLASSPTVAFSPAVASSPPVASSPALVSSPKLRHGKIYKLFIKASFPPDAVLPPTTVRSFLSC